MCLTIYLAYMHYGTLRMTSTPIPFEDEYPDGAAALLWFYHEHKGRFPDKKGVLHKLPCYLHCGKDFCRKIEYHWL